jgi:hypothetical protein
MADAPSQRTDMSVAAIYQKTESQKQIAWPATAVPAPFAISPAQ